MASRITTMLVFVAILVTVVACSDDDDKGTKSTSSVPNELLGAWTFQSASVGGMSIALSYVLPWVPSTTEARITVNTDSSYLYEDVASDSSVVFELHGTFSVEGSSFVMSDNSGFSMAGTWEVNGPQLSLSSDVEGYPLEIIATR